MQTIQRFFLFCSGVERNILAQCPSDTNKYAGIGATVFFTGLLAFFSSGYALYTVFDNAWAAVAFGLVWGTMIFNLDRYIVMSMKSRGAWWKDLLVALPRLALAVLLAVVISKPLELKIFDKEIQGELIKMEQELFKDQEDLASARFTAQISDLEAQVDGYRAQIKQKTELKTQLEGEALKEADGTGGSKIRNMGPIYKAKKESAEKAAADLAATEAELLPKIAALEGQLTEARGDKRTTIQSLERSRYNGMAARLEALARLSAGSNAIRIASIFIMLLFIAIESAPILVKLISTRSPYDLMLHQHESVFEIQHQKEVLVPMTQLKKQIHHDQELETLVLQAKLDMEKAKIETKLRQKLDDLQKGTLVEW